MNANASPVARTTAATRTVLTVLLVTVLGGPAVVANAAQTTVSTGEELVARATEALDGGDDATLARLASADRYRTFDAINELLGGGDAKQLELAARLAELFETAFGETGPSRRVRTFAAWTADQRSSWKATKELKSGAIDAFEQGRIDDAMQDLQDAVSRFRTLGDRVETARTLSTLGAVAGTRGESRRGLEWLDLAAVEARRAGDLNTSGVIAVNRAYALDDLGESEETIEALRFAARIARDSADADLESRAQINLGATLDRLGRYEEARTAFVRAADIAAELGGGEPEANAWFNLGVLAGNAGDRDRQRADWQHALQITEQSGLGPFSAEIHIALARLARETSDWEKDRSHLERARPLVAATDHPQLLAMLDLAEARHRLARGRYEQALPHIAAAEQRLAGLDTQSLSIRVHEAQAIAQYHLGRYELAEQALRRSLASARASGRADSEANGHDHLGFLLFQTGRTSEGLAELARAAEIRRTLESARSGYDLNLLGFLRLRSGDLTGARSALAEALTVFRGRENATGELEALIDLGRVELAEGGLRRDEGLRRLAEARTIAERVDDPLGQLHIGLLETEAALVVGERDAAAKALARAERAATRTTSVEYGWKLAWMRARLQQFDGRVAAAIVSYRNAIERVEERRSRMRHAAGRAAALDDRIAPYRDLTGLLLAQGRVGDAWSVARAGKARTFVESLLPPSFDLMRDSAMPAMLADTGVPTASAEGPGGVMAAVHSPVTTAMTPSTKDNGASHGASGEGASGDNASGDNASGDVYRPTVDTGLLVTCFTNATYSS